MPRRTQDTQDTEVVAPRGTLSVAVTQSFASHRVAGEGEPVATTRALMSGTATRADRQARIHEALHEAGLVGSVTPVGEAPRISPRQTEVLMGITEGLSNTELARALFMDVNTVKGHQGNLYRKFGVNTRVELVIEATRVGILAPIPGAPRARRPRAARPAHVPSTGPDGTDATTATDAEVIA